MEAKTKLTNQLAASLAPRYSLYSLRHSFEDRMLKAGIDYRIRKDLMGQRLSGEEYGEGASLDQAAKLLKPISF